MNTNQSTTPQQDMNKHFTDSSGFIKLDVSKTYGIATDASGAKYLIQDFELAKKDNRWTHVVEIPIVKQN